MMWTMMHSSSNWKGQRRRERRLLLTERWLIVRVGSAFLAWSRAVIGRCMCTLRQRARPDSSSDKYGRALDPKLGAFKSKKREFKDQKSVAFGIMIAIIINVVIIYHSLLFTTFNASTRSRPPPPAPAHQLVAFYSHRTPTHPTHTTHNYRLQPSCVHSTLLLAHATASANMPLHLQPASERFLLRRFGRGGPKRYKDKNDMYSAQDMGQFSGAKNKELPRALASVTLASRSIASHPLPFCFAFALQPFVR